MAQGSVEQTITEMYLGILSKSCTLPRNKQLNQKCFYHHVINLVFLSLSKTKFIFKRSLSCLCKHPIQIMLVSK